jgi:hypothetical protein
MNEGDMLLAYRKSFFYDQKLFQDGVEKSFAEQNIFPDQYFRVSSWNDMQSGDLVVVEG